MVIGWLRRGVATTVVAAAASLLATAPAVGQTDAAPAEPTTIGVDVPATSAAPGAEDVTAAAAAIDGWVADGDSGLPLGGICVVFYFVASDAWDGMAITSGDGSWSFTPAQSGPQRIATFAPTTPGDCTSLPLAEGPVPEWAFDVPLQPADPLTAAPPTGAATVLDGTNEIGLCLGDTQLYRGGCELRLGGPGVIRGTVLQPGALPVAGACIFVLTDISGSPTGGPGITDAEGHYSLSGLPEGLDFYVGVVPSTPQRSCTAEQSGPPLMPGPGELQPEFYPDVWADLTDPELDDDPTGWAAARGATPVRASAAGIDVCLSTDPGGTDPRADCSAATEVTPVSTAPVTDPTTVVAEPAAAAEPASLAFTGRDPVAPAAVGLALVALGLVGVIGSRRSLPPRTH